MFGAIRLKLYHQTGADAGQALAWVDESTPAFRWQTCLRSLALVPETVVLDKTLVPEVSPTMSGEWLEGDAAYRRLLEIVCGLHSPLVGETEVFGQFKDAIQVRLAKIQDARPNAAIDSEEVAFAATLRQWAKALIEDVKLVRQKHLLDLGSQSYGSLVRREVREFDRPQIEFIGSGHLALEIMPWLLKALKKEAQVIVHARDLEKARLRFSDVAEVGARDSLQFSEIAKGPKPQNFGSQRVLIVAAPMTSNEIIAWASGSSFDLVIDLRGESRHDALNEMVRAGGAKKLRSLEEVFSSIEQARGLADQKKSAALELIEKCVEARLLTATHRPFGWDDVWS